jgi:hypothetical protein
MIFCLDHTEQVQAGMVEQVPVQESYAGPGFEEKWFKCTVSNESLVSPEDPFHGYWGQCRKSVVEFVQKVMRSLGGTLRICRE